MSFLKSVVGGIAANAVSNALGGPTIGSLANTAGALLGGANNLMSSLRSRNIPLNADNFAPKEAATAQMGSDDDDNDWRVRLNIPTSVAPFMSSPIFTPLRESGGLIFPYTPTITISNAANYSEQPITHSNFQYINYVGSRVSEISVNADFFVEDAIQAQYWLSVVHFLRSVTKMFTGGSDLAGNPPVILYFNAYGNFVFKDVPVVVKSFSMTLPKEVDYITTNMSGPSKGTAGSFGADSTGALMNTASQIAGVASAFGQTNAANAIRAGANILNAVSGLVGGSSQGTSLNGPIGGRSGENDTHVPTQSTLAVSLQPIYSRTRIRKFNLDTFISGGYVKDGFI
jgi:hypothetical protein